MVYDLIYQNAFTSDRKIMSVVVREQSTGRLFVFAKGAESQIMERLSSSSKASPLRHKID